MDRVDANCLPSYSLTSPQYEANIDHSWLCFFHARSTKLRPFELTELLTEMLRPDLNLEGAVLLSRNLHYLIWRMR